MRSLSAALILLATQAPACDTGVCVVDPDALALTQIITFDDQSANYGPGRSIDDLLVLPGAVFGERFAGQELAIAGSHDVISGAAFAPLTPLAGAEGQSLSLAHFGGSARTVLNGYGHAAFPSRDGQGEGAISVLFDQDQPALAFHLRGGEGGAARIQFLRRDGSVISVVPVSPIGEHAIGFARPDAISDIAGFVLTNSDDQGIALDNLRFGPPPDMG